MKVEDLIEILQGFDKDLIVSTEDDLGNYNPIFAITKIENTEDIDFSAGGKEFLVIH